MSTYIEEKAAKDLAHARRAKKYTFRASGYDILDRRASTPEDGAQVVKVQPHGCPKNGTFGMVYVADAATGEFIGMVDARSLES